jgi:NIPSNAP
MSFSRIISEDAVARHFAPPCPSSMAAFSSSSNEGKARLATTSAQGGQAVTEYQLRIYKISVGHMAEFTEGWRTHIVPSRERFGFKIVTALADTESGDFVWLLRWDGPEEYEAADRAYYESPGRKSISWNSAPFIMVDELRILRQVPFQ